MLLSDDFITSFMTKKATQSLGIESSFILLQFLNISFTYSFILCVCVCEGPSQLFSTSTTCVLEDEVRLSARLSHLTYPKFILMRYLYHYIILIYENRDINYLVAIKAISNVQTVSEINAPSQTLRGGLTMLLQLAWNSRCK